MYAFPPAAQISNYVAPATLSKFTTHSFRDTQYLKTVDFGDVEADLSFNAAFSNCTSITSLYTAANDCDAKVILKKYASVFEQTNVMNVNGLKMVIESSGSEPTFQRVFSNLIYANCVEYSNYFFVKQYVEKTENYVINNVIKSTDTDYQKAIKIHDWICNRVKYDPIEAADKDHPRSSNHFDGSVFLHKETINGKTSFYTVCDGYARAYNILMNKAGVTCYSTSCPPKEGKYGHAWNYIKINGKFYQVDVCWDNDCGDYFYFMCSDDEFNAENNSHSKYIWKAFSDSNYENAVTTLPKATSSLNNLGDVNLDGMVTKADYTALQKHINKTVLFNNAEKTTRADINCDGQIDKTDLTMLNDYLSQSLSLGDVVKDGIVDIYDKGYVQRYLNNSIKNPLTSEELKRADMNLDGKVDNTDLELITAAIQNNVTYHSVTTVKDYSINYVKTH